MTSVKAFFEPRGVAIIGASDKPDKLSNGILKNMLQYGYKGGVYPVNPKNTEILGKPCYADIASVPRPGRSGGRDPARTGHLAGAGGLREKRRQGRDRHFRRIQGNWRKGQRTGKPAPRYRKKVRHAHDRAELRGHFQPGHRHGYHLHQRPAGQGWDRFRFPIRSGVRRDRGPRAGQGRSVFLTSSASATKQT